MQEGEASLLESYDDIPLPSNVGGEPAELEEHPGEFQH